MGICMYVFIYAYDVGQVNVRDIDGANPLCDACNSGRLNCVELLLKYGAEVNPKLSWTTPLHEATLKGQPLNKTELIMYFHENV